MHEGRVVAGKYRIQSLVGTGSMGAVYQAVHLDIGKRVALKVTLPESSLEMIRRFRREARLAATLESDYIVQVFDAGCDELLGPYLVTELLVGEDLDARLGRDRWLGAPTVAAIGYQIARGLAKAHAASVIHRDIKPGNIFLAERDDGARVAKILDFGICKRMGDLSDGRVTAAGMTLGTPEYMSPEQATAVPDLDGRSDVWSLAATLYEALCGRTPHAGARSRLDALHLAASADAVRLTSLAPWLPRALTEAIDDALLRDRDRRTPDAATFARALEQAVPGARWTLSGAHPAAADDPSLSDDQVEFFRREGLPELRQKIRRVFVPAIQR